MFQIRILFMVQSNEERYKEGLDQKAHSMLPFAYKTEEIWKHAYVTYRMFLRIKQKIRDRDKRSRGDKVGVAVLSIAVVFIVLTFRIMLMLYTLKCFEQV